MTSGASTTRDRLISSCVQSQWIYSPMVRNSNGSEVYLSGSPNLKKMSWLQWLHHCLSRYGRSCRVAVKTAAISSGLTRFRVVKSPWKSTSLRSPLNTRHSSWRTSTASGIAFWRLRRRPWRHWRFPNLTSTLSCPMVVSEARSDSLRYASRGGCGSLEHPLDIPVSECRAIHS